MFFKLPAASIEEKQTNIFLLYVGFEQVAEGPLILALHCVDALCCTDCCATALWCRDEAKFILISNAVSFVE